MTTETTDPPKAADQNQAIVQPLSDPADWEVRKTEQREISPDFSRRLEAMTADELRGVLRVAFRELWFYEASECHDREEAVKVQIYSRAHTHHERCRAAGNCARILHDVVKAKRVR